MYPIHDTDAQLLLATLIAAKRRPAALTDIVAAAEFMGFPVTAPAAWATAFERFFTHGLLSADGEGYVLTPTAVQLVEGRGALVGALVVSEDDQVMAIMKSGKVIRSNVDEVKRTGRNTQGVTFAKPDKGDTILSIARNEEKDEPEDGGDAAANGTAETAQSGENVNNADEA